MHVHLMCFINMQILDWAVKCKKPLDPEKSWGMGDILKSGFVKDMHSASFLNISETDIIDNLFKDLFQN